MNIGMLMTIIGALVVCTNVITEVLKKSFSNFPAQITATIVAMVLTLCAFFGYAAIEEMTVEWYMVVGAIVGGFFVSYGAQFGFDKLQEIVSKYKFTDKNEVKNNGLHE